eukprot:1704513-Rhodomonas_salina.2
MPAQIPTYFSLSTTIMFSPHRSKGQSECTDDITSSHCAAVGRGEEGREGRRKRGRRGSTICLSDVARRRHSTVPELHLRQPISELVIAR